MLSVKDKCNLTVIIPFLNEGEEVYNTIKNIRETSNSYVDIILINDASTDGYDYEKIAKDFGSHYVYHSERKGIASSRDEGVNMCQTDYFLLLDAHMRFYQNDWVSIIVRRLRENDRVLLCCQTKELMVDDQQKVVSNEERPISYGAFVNLYDGLFIFEPKWIITAPSSLSSDCHFVDVPCVLGAGYATSKRYWQYLKGLTGLKQYGNDEAYISIKVWLQGGKCTLLTDLVIGHIYRNKAPYEMDYLCRLYNRLLLTELLLPLPLKKKVKSALRYKNKSQVYSKAVWLILQDRIAISELKEYNNHIFEHDFTFFEKINNPYGLFTNQIKNVENLLKTIAYKILIGFHSVTNLGLIKGKMGLVIYLFHYAQYTNNSVFRDLALIYLDGICESIDANLSLNFHSGLCGIGWGIEYLSQHGFINDDVNEVLLDVDQKVMEVNLSKIQDINKDFGLGGITHYVISRLYGQRNIHYFNSEYISELTEKIEIIISKETFDCDSFDVYVDFLNYHHKRDKAHYELFLFDITFLSEDINKYTEDNINSCDLGLKGLAGLGLNLIFELTRNELT